MIADIFSTGILKALLLWNSLFMCLLEIEKVKFEKRGREN